MSAADVVVAEAQRWLRTPWRHNARVLGAGVDCAQLAIACYQAAGIAVELDVGRYSRDWMLHRSEEVFLCLVRQHLPAVEAPVRGGLAVWKFGRCFSHCAVIIEWPRIIHAHRPERMVCWGDGEKGSQLAGRPVLFFGVPQ